MALEGSYSDACCEKMQYAARESLVSWISKDCIYLITTYDEDEGDGYIVKMTDKEIEVLYCPFCGKKLK